jgi:hypothetical protein
MSDPLNAFLHEAPGPKPTLHLAAFGKHPGWDDHLDDLGIETESLAVAKQLIYLQGLASQIDSAAWEDLAPSRRLGEFNHRLLWTGAAGFLAGSLWSSQDGKGRSKYPMVLCAHIRGAPPERALGIFPVLDELKAACRVTASAADVRRILEAGRDRLRAQLEAAGEAPADDGARPALPPAPRQALHRILYEIQGQMKEMAPGALRGRGPMEAASRRLRLPAAPADGAALVGWSAFVRSQIDPEVPLLGMAASEGGWIDVVAGRPSGPDFFCLRATTAQLPLTSEIPYTLDPPFTAAADAVLDDPAGLQASPRTIFGPRSAGGFTLFPWGPGGPAAEPPVAAAGDPAPPSLRWLKAAFILLAVAIVGATLYMALHHG